MSDGADVPPTGLSDELSGALRRLALSGVPAEPEASGPSARPLPSLGRAQTLVGRRPATPEALAVADRILLAADGERRHRAPPLGAPLAAQPSRTSTPSAASQPSTVPMDPVIEVIGPTGLRIELRDGDSVVIGRDPGPGGISISNFEVSRQHVRLDVRGGVLEVTDLGSTNGTSIVRTGESTEIVRDVQVPMHPGDQLLVNGYIVLCSVGGIS